jgi:hypothetical protein
MNRRSGAHSERPLVPCDYEGQQYVVSMLGDESEWVQDVRAAGGAAIIKRVATRPVRAYRSPAREPRAHSQGLVPDRVERPPAHPVPYDAPVADFEAIAGQYPIFRVDPA